MPVNAPQHGYMAADSQTPQYIDIRQTAEGPIKVTGSTSCTRGLKIPRPDRGAGVFDGAWSEWHWDGSALTIDSGYTSGPPLYYASDSTGIRVSTDLVMLLDLGVSPDLDWPALSVALRLQYFISDHTPFEHIRVVQPHTRIIWRDGTLAQETTAEPIQPADFTFDQAVDAYISLMEESIARRPPQGTSVLPLSGGRDSRHILLELAAQGMKPDLCVTTNTLYDPSLQEITIAGQLCERLGVEHAYVPRRTDTFTPQIRTLERTDYSTIEHAWTLNLIDRVASFTTLYDGQNGGNLFGRYAVADKTTRLLMDRNYAGFCNELMYPLEPQLPFLLTSDALHKLSRQVAEETLILELRKHENASNPAQSYFVWNRSTRGTGNYTYRMLQNPVVQTPLGSMDIVRFALSLPVEISSQGNFQEVALRRRFPDFSHIPFVEESGDNSFRTRLYVWQMLKYTLTNRAAGVANRRFVSSHAAKALISGKYSDIEWWSRQAPFVLGLEALLNRYG